MDYVEIITLYELVRKYKVEEEVAKKLGIKKSSLRRQMNRIKAFYHGKTTQKRSGKKIAEKYSQAMRSVLETKLGQPIITKQIETPRKIQFHNFDDLLRYRQPIAHISSIRLDEEENMWELYIAISSTL